MEITTKRNLIYQAQTMNQTTFFRWQLKLSPPYCLSIVEQQVTPHLFVPQILFLSHDVPVFFQELSGLHGPIQRSSNS